VDLGKECDTMRSEEVSEMTKRKTVPPAPDPLETYIPRDAQRDGS